MSENSCIWCGEKLIEAPARGPAAVRLLVLARRGLKRPAYRALARHMLSGCQVCYQASQIENSHRMCTEGQTLAKAACDEAPHQEKLR